MSNKRKIERSAARRAERVRNRLSGERPRVSIFRSLNHIYAQIIDDKNSRTIIGLSSLNMPDLKGDKSERAHAVGIELAKRAKAEGVSLVAFDRGSCKYHGRVKALADGLREGGLEF